MTQTSIPGDYPVELVITAQDVNTVLQGLSQLPYYAVAQLINQIQTQTDVQVMQYMNKQFASNQAPTNSTEPSPAQPYVESAEKTAITNPMLTPSVGPLRSPLPCRVVTACQQTSGPTDGDDN